MKFRNKPRLATPLLVGLLALILRSTINYPTFFGALRAIAKKSSKEEEELEPEEDNIVMIKRSSLPTSGFTKKKKNKIVR